MPTSQPVAPYDGPALALDYLAEMFARLRREPRKVDLDKFLPDSLDLTDEQAVRRLARALLKLVYPAGDYPQDAVARWTRVALQCREALYDEASRHRPVRIPATTHRTMAGNGTEGGNRLSSSERNRDDEETSPVDRVRHRLPA